MNRDPILFRVDGTPRSGYESLYRCLTVAAALQRRRRPTYFLSQLDPGSLGLHIKRVGNSWLDTGNSVGTSDDLEETIQEIRRLHPAAVIVDSPEANEDYLAELGRHGAMVVSIDHLAARQFPSRLVINPLLGPSREGYEVDRGTQLLLGPRFAIVRSEIRRNRPVRAQEPPEPFRALIALGDDDPHGQAGDLAKLLLNMPKVQRVDMAIRSYHPQLAEMQELASRSQDRLEIASEPAEIAARVAKAHFGVTAGNGWSLELACVGLPQLVIVQAEAHWPTAQRLEEEGAAVCLGWHESVSANTIRQAVQNILGDPLERQAMSRCGRQLIDGRGPDRLVTALEVMLHPSRQVEFAAVAA